MHIRFNRLRIIDSILIGVTLIVYFINRICRPYYGDSVIEYLLKCHFNDFIGSITFLAYTNLVLSIKFYRLNKFLYIEILIIIAGLFWEYVTPLFRPDTVSDVLDIVSYMLGASLYYFINRKVIHKYKID